MKKDEEFQLLTKSTQWGELSEIEKVVIMEKRIVFVRWLGIVCAAVTVPFLGYQWAAFMFGIIGFAAVYNVIFQFYIIAKKSAWLLKPAIITIGDIMMASAVVFITGGIHSDFFVVYFLIAILSAIRFGGRAAGISTLLSILFYSLVIFLRGPVRPVYDLANILFRMGFVATTGIFVGYVGDKARQVELDLQRELDQAHAHLNESTALLNANLELDSVLQVAVAQSRLLIDAEFGLILTKESGLSFLPRDLKDNYDRPYYSDVRSEAVMREEDVAYIIELFQDVTRLSSIFQKRISGESSVELVECHMNPQLARILTLKENTMYYLVSAQLFTGETEIGTLYLLKTHKPAQELRKTVLNALSVFTLRISAAITNSLMYTQSRMQAVTDSVTGLYNHRFLHEFLNDEIKKVVEQHTPLSLIVLDVDSFKQFNDMYGHSIGDTALRSVADMIRPAIKDRGIAARFGGDEFVIILPGMSHQEAMTVAESIRARAKNYRHLTKNHALATLSISLGVATAPQSGETSHALFHAADLALYDAKHAGKNVVRSAESTREGGAFRDEHLTALGEYRSLTDSVEVMQRDMGAVNPQMVETLLAALKAKDPGTYEHSKSVSAYAERLARRLGLSDQEVETIRIGSLIHDVGKIGIPDYVLTKAAKLTKEEYDMIKEHPTIGVEILKPLRLYEGYLPIVRYHHEWMNGKGYPHQLKGREIPLEARIVAICDAFDAMTSNRPYKAAMSYDKALHTIESLVNEQFDQDVWEQFREMIQEEISVIAN